MKLRDLKIPFDQLTLDAQIELLKSIRVNRVQIVRQSKSRSKKEVKPRKSRPFKPKTLDEALAWAYNQLGKDKP